MRLLDLTVPIPNLETQREWPDDTPLDQVTSRTRRWHIGSAEFSYVANVHFFTFWSMAGTYLDFPGHIVATDDGSHAGSPVTDRLYRVESTVLHLDRSDAPGPVSARDLQRACPSLLHTPGLVINALGPKRFDEIPERSVYFSGDALDWIVGRGVSLLLSDIYESDTNPQGVFPRLFAAGIVTVCCLQPLAAVDAERAWVTALPLCVAGASQTPCRVVAEIQ